MRNDQLARAFRQYDDHANLNQHAIYQHKKEIYQREIALTAYHSAWRRENLRPLPVDVGFMQSLFLGENAMFREIRAVFVRYNGQLATAVEEYDLKPKVIHAMARYMHTIMKTEDRQHQLSLLKKGYDWFMSNLDPKLKYKPEMNYLEQLQKICQKSFSPQRAAVQQSNMNLPSQRADTESRLYRWNARTVHEQLHTPSERLKGYKTRIINFDSSRIETAPRQEPPADSYRARIKFERPAFSLKFKTELPEEVPNDSTIKLDTAATKHTDPEELPPEPQTSEAVAPQPQIQLGQEPAEQEVEEQQPEQQGALDPRVKNYLFPVQVSHEKAMARLTYAHQAKQHNHERTLKEESANIASVKLWARNKGRLRSQQSRRLESTREFSRGRNMPGQQSAMVLPHEKFVLCGPQQHEKSDTFQPLEERVDRDRVELISRRTHHMLKSQPREYEVNTVRGTSLYDRARMKTEGYATTARPFSQILSEHSKARINQQSLQEVSRIKSLFAKHKVNIEMGKLADGLSLPEDASTKLAAQISTAPLQLLSNPYFKVGKKKKKKGKKKK